MIQAIMSVVSTGVMAHPLSAPIHVGSVGMSFLFAEVAMFLGRMRGRYPRRTVLRYVLMAAADLRPATAALMATVLCHR